MDVYPASTVHAAFFVGTLQFLAAIAKGILQAPYELSRYMNGTADTVLAG